MARAVNSLSHSATWRASEHGHGFEQMICRRSNSTVEIAAVVVVVSDGWFNTASGIRRGRRIVGWVVVVVAVGEGGAGSGNT